MITTKIEGHNNVELPKWPGALKTAEEVSTALRGIVSPDRLTQLAISGHMPHWRIDDGTPQFQTAEVKFWLSNNMLRHVEGRPIPTHIRVVTDAPEADKGRAPAALRNMNDLRALPLHTGLSPGVYFLCLENEVVYVGQSVNVLGRLQSHAGVKTWDAAYMLPWPEDDLDALEGALIRALKPPQNGRIGKKRGSKITAPADQGRDEGVLAQVLA